ncbi:MAG TPA: hypothetical protein VG652_00735 [Gaiellaceae bacterium]|nr:hypothetical protein [Gaiellaceae bacterium]
MTSPERRTPEQIRAEIESERTALSSELSTLRAEARQTGRLAGSGVAALGSLLVLVRLLARRRHR